MFFQLSDRFEILVAAAKALDNLDGGTDFVEGLHLQYIEVFQFKETFIRVFFKERFYSAGFISVAGKVIAFTDVLCAFTASERRLIVSDVADEVEGIIITADFSL